MGARQELGPHPISAGKRWDRPRSDEDAPESLFGPYTGSISDLTAGLEDDDDGLVMPDGSPIGRPQPQRRTMGFRAPGA